MKTSILFFCLRNKDALSDPKLLSTVFTDVKCVIADEPLVQKTGLMNVQFVDLNVFYLLCFLVCLFVYM